MSGRASGVVVVFAVLFLLSVDSQAAYTFTKIADTSGGAYTSISPFSQILSLNESGDVSFAAQTPGNTSGIFKGSGGSVTTIASATDLSLLSTRTSINDSGVVAFSWNSVVYTGSGGAPTPLYGAAFAATRGAGINNSGDVVFQSLPGTEYILTGNGGPLTEIATDAGLYSNFNRYPEINNSGQVAWSADYDAAATHDTLYRTAGGVDTVIADTTVQNFTFLDQFVINNNGVVAFGASAGLSRGIYYGSGGGVTTIVDNSGPFSTFTDGNHRPKPGYNDLGDIAFWATTDAGAEGIYTGTDPIAERVVAVGDTLFGKTITDLSFSGDAFNNAGSLAFVAVFNDNSRAVIRADVPEPASAAMLAFSVLLGTVRSRRRCC